MQNNKPYIIGITGGIGTGKSQVSRYLTSLGYTVIDADQVAREVVEPGEVAWMKVLDRFGESVLNPDKTLNRRKLGEIIFGDDALRLELNDILHPLIRMRINAYIEQYHSESVIFIDVPLLFETESRERYDEVVLIYAPDEVALSRILDRDRLSTELLTKKIESQLSIEIKRHLADTVIYNIGTLDELKEEVNAYLKRIKQKI